MSALRQNHSKISLCVSVIGSFCANLLEWMLSNVMETRLETARLGWINCSEPKRPTGNECLSIANATPLPGFLQPRTPRAGTGHFFNHSRCRTSTMAQVPTLVAKSPFNAAQLPLSSMKTVFWSCRNYLKQPCPSYTSRGAKITQPIMAGCVLVMEKEWNCFICIIDPAERP